MTDMTIEFHALPEELSPLFKEAADKLGFHAFATRFPPFSIVEIDTARLDEAFADPSIDGMLFTMKPMDLTGMIGTNTFLDMCPDALVLNMGRMGEHGLDEFWFATRFDASKGPSTWAPLAKKIRAIAKTGVLSVNRDGTTSPYRNHRFTKGARALELTGVPMVQSIGRTRFLFHD